MKRPSRGSKKNESAGPCLADQYPCHCMLAYIVSRGYLGFTFKLKEESKHVFRMDWTYVARVWPVHENLRKDRLGYHTFDCLEEIIDKNKLWDFVRAQRDATEAFAAALERGEPV